MEFGGSHFDMTQLFIAYVNPSLIGVGVLTTGS